MSASSVRNSSSGASKRRRPGTTSSPRRARGRPRPAAEHHGPLAGRRPLEVGVAGRDVVAAHQDQGRPRSARRRPASRRAGVRRPAGRHAVQPTRIPTSARWSSSTTSEMEPTVAPAASVIWSVTTVATSATVSAPRRSVLTLVSRLSRRVRIRACRVSSASSTVPVTRVSSWAGDHDVASSRGWSPAQPGRARRTTAPESTRSVTSAAAPRSASANRRSRRLEPTSVGTSPKSWRAAALA